jgi:hypothetical protein
MRGWSPDRRRSGRRQSDGVVEVGERCFSQPEFAHGKFRQPDRGAPLGSCITLASASTPSGTANRRTSQAIRVGGGGVDEGSVQRAHAVGGA